jgi:DNA phosphorothioation-dependent restriction protein DptG
VKFKKFNEFKEELKSSEVEQIDEGLKDTIKKALDKGADFAKSVWDGIKRESKETKEAVRILSDMTKGNEVTDVQKKFVKAQAVNHSRNSSSYSNHSISSYVREPSWN